MEIKKWFMPELTKKEVHEGFYPVMITAAKCYTKEAEKDGKTFEREVIELTFKTLQDVPFPDGTTDKILVNQNYYFDVDMHRNALNGLARAFGISELSNTDQFEGKTGMIGIINRSYQTSDGETKVNPQFGYGLFSYAPINQNAKVEFIANEMQGALDDNAYKEWFKRKKQNYIQPK